MSTLSIPSGSYRSSSSNTSRAAQVWLRRMVRKVGQIADDALTVLLAEPKRYEPRNAEELLAWADAYQSTQPSYADELRAIVQYHQSVQEAASARV